MVLFFTWFPIIIFCYPTSYHDHFFIFCLSSFSPPITSHYSILFVSHHFLSLFLSYLLPIIAFCLSSLLFVSHHSFSSPITPFRLPSLLFVSHHSFSSPITPFRLPTLLFVSHHSFHISHHSFHIPSPLFVSHHSFSSPNTPLHLLISPTIPISPFHFLSLPITSHY